MILYDIHMRPAAVVPDEWFSGGARAPLDRYGMTTRYAIPCDTSRPVPFARFYDASEVSERSEMRCFDIAVRGGKPIIVEGLSQLQDDERVALYPAGRV